MLDFPLEGSTFESMPSSIKTTHLRDLFTEGLGHEDQFVREACYGYWEKQPDRGATQARHIIDALRAYGTQAFSYSHIAYKIPLDRACLGHLIETLLEAKCFDDTDMESFGRWFKWCLSVEHDLLPELETFLKSERASDFEGNGFVEI